jgi:hypothetical protein
MNASNPSFACRVAPGVLLAALTFGSVFAASAVTPNRNAIKPERELLITSPAVLDSDIATYPGSWSFGALIEELVGKEHASDCVREWLATWQAPQSIEKQIVTPRAGFEEKIVRPWQALDGYDPEKGEPWKPKLENAPFRLLAIVNRMDLAAPAMAGTVASIRQQWRQRGFEREFNQLLSNSTSGSSASYYDFVSNDFGEGRLVFGALDTDGKPLPGDWTVIFEYKLRENPAAIASGRTDVTGPAQWANEWHTLGSIELTDPEFARRLEQITRKFTHRKSGSNQIALGQIRTSEAAFGADRQFRQYVASGERLRLTPLSMTPTVDFLVPRSPELKLLSQFLHDQNELIVAGLHNLPSSLSTRKQSIPLLAAAASIPPGAPDFHWKTGPNVSRDARRIFSMSTCTGCHAGETGCAEGLHIHTRAAGEAARTSDFLRIGAPLRINDPAVRGSKVEFREMDDRAKIFAALLETKDRTRLAALRDVLQARLRRTH